MSEIRQGWTSASNAQPDSLCAGRHIAQRGIPEPSKSAEASGGTKIHLALAGQFPDGSKDTNAVGKLALEERETYDACRSIEQKIVKQFFGEAERTSSNPLSVFRHLRNWVQIKSPNGQLPFMHSGEADVIYREGVKLLIADYKTLSGDTPDSSRNLQLRDLAVLAWGALAPIEEVATVIIQPFVTHSPEICLYTREELGKAQDEMFQRVLASNNPDSPRTPGMVQCNFCLAKDRCQEYQNWAGAMLPEKLLPLDVPMVGWTPEQRARAAEALGPAFDLLNNIRASLKAGIERDPNYCPGFMLAPGNKREVINDPQLCYNRFEKLGGSLSQFIACISVGKGKLREAMNEVTGAKGAMLDNAMRALCDGIVEVHQNEPSLKKIE